MNSGLILQGELKTLSQVHEDVFDELKLHF